MTLRVKEGKVRALSRASEEGRKKEPKDSSRRGKITNALEIGKPGF